MNLTSKYNYNKNYNKKVYNSKNINEKSNRGSYHYQKIKGIQNINGNTNPQGVKISRDLNTCTKQDLGGLQNTASKTNEKFEFESHYPDVFSAVITIDGDNSKACVVLDDINQNVDIYQPSPKRYKMINTSGDINTKINEDCVKISYKSNLTVLPSKSKPEEVGIQLENLKNETLSTGVHGFVGVEYVVKILSESIGGQPKYECALCEVVMDGSCMQNHLIDYKHTLKFCEKHFPTALHKYRQYICNVPLNKNDNVMAQILNKLAIAIEQHHGRDLPYECRESEYNINRHEILSKVYSCRHASEQYGPTFTHIVDSKEVDKITEEINRFNPTIHFLKDFAFDSHVNSTSSHIRPPTRQKRPLHWSMHRCYDEGISGDTNLDNNTHKIQDILKNNCRNTVSSSKVIYKHLRQTPSLSRSISSFHRESFSPLDDIQSYRHLVDKKIMDLNEAYQIYRADPERHPSYDREWQMFWKRCKNELIENGLDYRTYNYQPEWVKFFKGRIEELYNHAVQNIKHDALESLYLSMTNENLVDEKYFEIDKAVAKQPLHLKKVQLISVLRLLTYLEEYLGSFGPQIVEILTKALHAETSFTPDFSTIQLSKENCGLLETAMGKFKGIVIAGVLKDPKHLTILRKAIDAIEFILFQSDKQTTNRLNIDNCATKGEICPKMNENIPNENHLLNDNLPQVDKKEFAFKLARLLAAQGKTDIDPAQLQKIISVHMLIEKKKQIKINKVQTP